MRVFWKIFPWLCVLLLGLYIWKPIHLRDVAGLTQAEEKKLPSATLAPERNITVHGNASGVSSYSATVKKTAPAVVNIFTTQKIKQNPMYDDPVFRQFFGDQARPNMQQDSNTPSSLGSGVIVSAEGYVLTNNHVIDQADTIVVALQDGRKAKATVVGTDPDTDLAVIKIDLPNLSVLPFKQQPTEVGDIVLAIGNPFGVGQTVTQGIISATGRTGMGIEAVEDFLQTDAAINPGNSGGALVDVAGNLVGINTAIFSKSGGSMGIGFAIPVTLAEQVMTSIISKGHVVRGWLGVEVRDVNTEQQVMNTNPDQQKGVLIAGVVQHGPADKGGLMAGDVIQKIDGEDVDTAPKLIKIISQKAPNSKLALIVKRQDEILKMSVTVEARPKREEQQKAKMRDDPSRQQQPQSQQFESEEQMQRQQMQRQQMPDLEELFSMR